MIDFCANNNFCILNSRVGKDNVVGAFICKSWVRWTVLSSTELFYILINFNMFDFCALFLDVHNPFSFFVFLQLRILPLLKIQTIKAQVKISQVWNYGVWTKQTIFVTVSIFKQKILSKVTWRNNAIYLLFVKQISLK